MGVEENKKTIQLVEEAWGRGDLGSLDQHFANDFDNSKGLPPGLPVGLESAKMLHGMVMQSFPDRKVHLLEMIGEGKKVMIRNRVTGTNKGGVMWLGAPPNNAPVDFESISVYEFDDHGKISAHYGLNDGYMLGVQVGVIEPPRMG